MRYPSLKASLPLQEPRFCGYRRIAFGNISDAVKLILESDGDRLDAEKLDLFNVAEIKKPRGGGMEIKFLTV